MRQYFNRNHVTNPFVAAAVTRIYNQFFQNFDAKTVLMIAALSLRHLRDHNSFFETYIESSPHRHSVYTILPYGYPPAADDDSCALNDEIDENNLREIAAEWGDMTQGLTSYYLTSHEENDPYQKTYDALFREAVSLLQPCNVALQMTCEILKEKNRLARSYIFDPMIYGLLLQPLLQRQKEFWESKSAETGATEPQRKNYQRAAQLLNEFFKDVREFNHTFLPNQLPPAPSHDVLAQRLENLFRNFCDFARRFDGLEFEHHSIFTRNGSEKIFNVFKSYMNMAFGELGDPQSGVHFIGNVRVGKFPTAAKPQ